MANHGPSNAGGGKCGSAEPLVSPERRSFLTRLSLGLSGLTALLIGIPFVGFLFAPVRERLEDAWRAIGSLDDFPVGQTMKAVYLDPAPLPWAGFSARSAAWVRRVDDETVLVLSMYCTHTGCPVHWVESTQLFFCPCHGGAFHSDGSVAAGPPPRPLDRYEARIRNRQIEVRTLPLPPPGA
jgi:menaquinol-cytochrome c reductase iron-sulfur subunit